MAQNVLDAGDVVVWKTDMDFEEQKQVVLAAKKAVKDEQPLAPFISNALEEALGGHWTVVCVGRQVNIDSFNSFLENFNSNVSYSCLYHRPAQGTHDVFRFGFNVYTCQDIPR